MEVKKLRVYYAGQRHYPDDPGLVDQIPIDLEPLVEAVVSKMRQRNPICCLDVEIDEDHREVIASTCSEYIEEKVRFGFALKNGKVNLTQLPPATFDEEVQQAAISVSCAGYDPIIREKFVDEKNGVAIFILFEILEKGPLGIPGPRGRQERYTLYRVRKGHKPEVLFSDHAWSRERHCEIVNLRIENNKEVVVDHFTTKNCDQIITKNCDQLTTTVCWDEITFDL